MRGNFLVEYFFDKSHRSLVIKNNYTSHTFYIVLICWIRRKKLQNLRTAYKIASNCRYLWEKSISIPNKYTLHKKAKAQMCIYPKFFFKPSNPVTKITSSVWTYERGVRITVLKTQLNMLPHVVENWYADCTQSSRPTCWICRKKLQDLRNRL